MAEIKNTAGDNVYSDQLQEATRRLLEAERTGATELDLSGLRIGQGLSADWIGWKILGQLHQLERLHLDGNQIPAIPSEGWKALGGLSKISWLDLRDNDLAAIPDEGWEAIGGLNRLGWLDLSHNQLSIPNTGWEALGRLHHLKSLYLERNQIQSVSAEGWQTLGRFASLQNLFFFDNEIVIPSEGWAALEQLQNLIQLIIGSTKTGPIPARGWQALGRLSKLEALMLFYDHMGEIPQEGWNALRGLVNLRALNLTGSGIVSIPIAGWEALSKLAKLETLTMSGNDIRDIPTEGWEVIGRLDNITELSLSSNNIAIMPSQGWLALSRLQKLEKLDLSYNKIGDIPLEGWQMKGKFTKLQTLNLSANPLPEDILAAASRGPESFFEYLEAARLRAAHPRTVKLVLLGEPQSGKTTLVEALNKNPTPCDPNRPETIGVNVRRIEKKSPEDGGPLYLATWDFAGQHMEYATHQFFLKSGGIHLILWKARLGSDYGQRDLWYWLELLKMRVKDPEFLLVTTHTGKTPAVLDLREIQNLYPGCKGHYEVELCDGIGMVALEEKILELASASPSMKSIWPAPWLAVRDAIRSMRTESPYISSEEFWRLCDEHEVPEKQAQRDLVDQLDKLGEIVYYADAALSKFVILDPTWVTELVAKVVRDKQVRDQGGTLNHVDLDRIWGKMPGEVREHVESLMDEYDLVYKTRVHQHMQPSIVVEALPSAPDEIRTMDIAGGMAQTEVIYRFPSLLRHLPPGVPTWAFARSRRYLKAGAGPWRNAARFEDTDTNSVAVVFSSEADREVRLRVAADYPPYFFGVLDSILRDTFKRYPGAQPESRIPCPCKPSCKYGHPRETVLKRKRDGKSEISCPDSGEDVSIGKLLEGFAPADTQAGALASLASLRRQLSAIQNGQNEELLKTCPSMFTLAPAKDFKLLDTYLEYATQKEELDLTLYCEWEKQWHPTQQSVYRFRPEQEWFASLKEKWSELAKVTRRVAPLTSLGASLLGVPAVGSTMKTLAEKAEKIAEIEKDPRSELAKDLGLRENAALIGLDARHLLARLIKHLDRSRGEKQPEFGGLHPYHVKEDGRLLWLCAEHLGQYESAR